MYQRPLTSCPAFVAVGIVAALAVSAQQLPSPSYQTGISLVLVDACRRPRLGCVGARTTQLPYRSVTRRPHGRRVVDGRIWIDASSGQVLRTELRFDRGSQSRVYVRTDYGPAPNSEVPVPLRMWEWYEGGDQIGRIGGDKTVIQGLATYSNFRRFQVATSEQVK